MAPEHALVAKQWSGVRRSDDQEHFFAVLDFANGQQVFQKVSTGGWCCAVVEQRRLVVKETVS
jgi:hypothetical protein